jgi:ABC-type molybdate transport system substrate-binding protein
MVKPVTLQPDAKAVLTQVKLGNIDAGMLYVTGVQGVGAKFGVRDDLCQRNASALYTVATSASARTSPSPDPHPPRAELTYSVYVNSPGPTNKWAE